MTSGGVPAGRGVHQERATQQVPRPHHQVCPWGGPYHQGELGTFNQRNDNYIYWKSLQLLDEDEEVAETLAIDKWNTDSVEEFLDTVMVRNDSIDISENLV